MKTETIQLGEISILVTRKAIKHVHLSVHPPSGRVTLVAPIATRLNVARAYAISKLSLPNVHIYLDAGHSQWLGWPRNLPKSVAIYRTESVAVVTVPPVLFFARIARPLIWLVNASAEAILNIRRVLYIPLPISALSRAS